MTAIALTLGLWLWGLNFPMSILVKQNKQYEDVDLNIVWISFDSGYLVWIRAFRINKPAFPPIIQKRKKSKLGKMSFTMQVTKVDRAVRQGHRQSFTILSWATMFPCIPLYVALIPSMFTYIYCKWVQPSMRFVSSNCSIFRTLFKDYLYREKGKWVSA